MSFSPQAARLMRYFEHDHLPEPLRSLSARFAELAEEVAHLEVADGAEQTTALRKLLEAKDCAVRSILGVNASRSAVVERIGEYTGPHVPPETLPDG